MVCRILKRTLCIPLENYTQFERLCFCSVDFYIMLEMCAFFARLKKCTLYCDGSVHLFHSAANVLCLYSTENLNFLLEILTFCIMLKM